MELGSLPVFWDRPGGGDVKADLAIALEGGFETKGGSLNWSRLVRANAGVCPPAADPSLPKGRRGAVGAARCS